MLTCLSFLYQYIHIYIKIKGTLFIENIKLLVSQKALIIIIKTNNDYSILFKIKQPDFNQ